MKKLLLVSSSRVHGSTFLAHVEPAIRLHFAGDSELLFVPYALADRDQYTKLVSDWFATIDVKVNALHRSNDPIESVKNANGIFIGGGNSFRLLKTLYDQKLIDPIRELVSQGKPYMGSSAGTNMACPTIRTTNDMPIVEPPSFNSLGLIPFQINPHFIDADPSSTHKGETREQRLAEYLEENDGPVVGIREGSWLEVNGNDCQLKGKTGMKFFEKGKSPQEFERECDLSFLMES